jgi:uncharacterized SAM-binding protein YcdF (DUF218 family)/GT2 family glycosyltransferase
VIPSGLIGVTAAFTFTWARIRRHGRLSAQSTADIIVVFGAETSGDQPSPELRARLDHAAELYAQRRAPTILCSGGHPGLNSEPRVMRRALVAAGVPAEAILLDETGSSTRRTLAAVHRVGNGRWRRILVVSSPYHMYRIVTEARRLGLPVMSSAPETTPLTTRLRPRLRQDLREVAAVWWYSLAPPKSGPSPFPPSMPSAVGSSPSAKKLAVVVLSLANEPGLVDAVRSLQTQTVPTELVVVNSGGGDPASTLRAAGVDVPLIDIEERLLPGAVRNFGIAATSAPVVGFLAADCMADPGWAAARLAEHDRGAAVTAGVLTVGPPRTLSAHASHLLLHHRARPESPPHDRVYALLSFRRSVLDRYGPFREDLLIGEDTEYAERLDPQENVGWAPAARTAHRYPRTPLAFVRDQFRRGRSAALHAFQLGDQHPRRRIAARNLRNISYALARARAVPDLEERRILLAASPLIVLGAYACALGVLTARSTGEEKPIVTAASGSEAHSRVQPLREERT